MPCLPPNSRSLQEVLEGKVCGDLPVELEKEVFGIVEIPGKDSL